MLVTSVVLLTNPFTVDRWGPFYLHGWTLIPAGISNHKPSKMWDEITYPFPIVYVETFEGAECVSNVISHFIMDVIPYPYVHVILNTFNFICIPHGTWISDLFKHDLGPTIVLFQRFIMLLILKPTYENCNWSFQCFDIYKLLDGSVTSLCRQITLHHVGRKGLYTLCHIGVLVLLYNLRDCIYALSYHIIPVDSTVIWLY